MILRWMNIELGKEGDPDTWEIKYDVITQIPGDENTTSMLIILPSFLDCRLLY